MNKFFITTLLLLTVTLTLSLWAESIPENVDEVLIGYFGPNDANHLEAGDMWCAATLAVEQANMAGGCKGRPFKLISCWSENPWGSGVKDVTRMAYVHNVCAIIGGIDGPSTHLAEQVVAKARLPLISGANADRTANLANVSWMFSAMPGHHLQAAALTEAIEFHNKEGKFIVISTTDHDSHLLVVELNKCFRKKQLSPIYHFELKTGRIINEDLIDRIIESKTDAIVIIAPSKDTAQLIFLLREDSFSGTIFGGPCMAGRTFTDLAGDSAEGAIFPVLYEPADKDTSFEKEFFNRFARHGDYLSAHTYDSVNMLIEAIRKAGLDRQRIRDELEKLSPWRGATGIIHWDQQGSNTRSVSTGTISNGRIKVFDDLTEVVYMRTTSSTAPR